MTPFTESPAHRLRSAYLRMHRVTNRAFRPFGMTADQYVVLRLLCEGDGISQQDLGEQCASDATTIGRMLNLLETKALIRREQPDYDRRTRLIYVTTAGRRMTRRLYAAAEGIRDTLNQTVSKRELKQLLNGLHSLSEAFEVMESGSLLDSDETDTPTRNQ